MFGKLKESMQQMQMMRRRLKDEQFRAILNHPKMQALLRNRSNQ